METRKRKREKRTVVGKGTDRYGEENANTRSEKEQYWKAK